MNKRHFTVWLHDVLMAALAYALALYVRLGPDMATMPLREAMTAFFLYLLMCGGTFYYFGLYRGVWRYTSLHDLTQIVRASCISTLLFVATAFLLTRAEAVPRSVMLMLLFILPCLLAAGRVGYRLLRERRLHRHYSGSQQNVLLIGAGDEAEAFIRTTARDSKTAWRVVGIIDDKGSRIGRLIHNVEVLGDVAALEKILTTRMHGDDALARLILTKAPNQYPSSVLRQLLDLSNVHNMPLARLPSLTELRGALEAGLNLVKPVAVEDLLGRPEIKLEREPISKMITGQTVIVTGGGGSIGSELTRQIAALNPYHLTILDNSEYNLYLIDQEIRAAYPQLAVTTLLADVRDKARIEAVFKAAQPALVFHAAALKHVPLAEVNIRETVLTNVQGTTNVANAARAAGASAMVMISTDKAINPTNIMGATKRIAEAYCQTLDMQQQETRFMTVRFGNVLGSSGSVVPLFQKQLAAGGPLTVTHADITRYFMTIREAVALVLQASAHGLKSQQERGKIFVLDMGQPIKIIDLARQMIQLAGLRPDEDIKIEITGLRPGEKLYEELFSVGEPPAPAGVDGVLVAAPRLLDAAQFAENVSQLLNAAQNLSPDTLLADHINMLVPDYIRPKAAAA